MRRDVRLFLGRIGHHRGSRTAVADSADRDLQMHRLAGITAFVIFDVSYGRSLSLTLCQQERDCTSAEQYIQPRMGLQCATWNWILACWSEVRAVLRICVDTCAERESSFELRRSLI